MLLSLEEIRALRRYQADKQVTKSQLAIDLNIARSTLTDIIKSENPRKVNKRTYQSIAKAIACDY